jgi:hypothetical protein
MRNKKDMHFN